jgi:hypothetical protein
LAALGCRFAVFKASQGVAAPRIPPPGPAAVSLLEFSAGAAQGLRRFSRKFFQERRVPGGAVSFKKIPHAGPSRLAWFFQKNFSTKPPRRFSRHRPAAAGSLVSPVKRRFPPPRFPHKLFLSAYFPLSTPVRRTSPFLHLLDRSPKYTQNV